MVVVGRRGEERAAGRKMWDCCAGGFGGGVVDCMEL